MLIRTNMEDMREKTHTRHYELYRQKRLEQMGFTDVDSENKPVSFQQTFEAKRSNHLAELQSKEDEVRQMFVVRVKEKEAELKDSEKDVSWTLLWQFMPCHTNQLFTNIISASCQIRETQERPCRGQTQVGGGTQEARRRIRRVQSTQVAARHLTHPHTRQEQEEIKFTQSMSQL